MTVHQVHSVRCDSGRSAVCHVWVAEAVTPQDAKNLARERGWAFRRRDGKVLHLCPACDELEQPRG